MIDAHGIYHPRQIEFSRLGLTYTVMSKRRFIELVNGGHVSGYDDPRMPTLAGMRRRGYPSEAVREFKKRFILTVLEENKGNQCRAARALKMHRNTLSRTIAELKIDVRPLRDGAKRPPRSARPVSYEKKAAR